MHSATPEARFAAIIDLLCRGTASRIAGGRLSGLVITLIYTRLRRLATRFAALAAHFRAGTLKPPARRGLRPSRPPEASPRPAATAPQPRPRPPSPLPGDFAWLVRLVGIDAAAGASQLQYLLAEPEMAALIEAAPQMRGILRPLCHMLGFRPPAILAPLPRPEQPGPVAPDERLPPTVPPVRRHRSLHPTAPPAARRILRACGPPLIPA